MRSVNKGRSVQNRNLLCIEERVSIVQHKNLGTNRSPLLSLSLFTKSNLWVTFALLPPKVTFGTNRSPLLSTKVEEGNLDSDRSPLLLSLFTQGNFWYELVHTLASIVALLPSSPNVTRKKRARLVWIVLLCSLPSSPKVTLASIVALLPSPKVTKVEEGKVGMDRSPLLPSLFTKGVTSVPIVLCWQSLPKG
ncbi:Transmembrane domain-containing protein [Brazilian cedratvirus IHUMI]|uniref:Transmembrane domain-containing protein n=1 Tax=Brazilian cedratvirus IHUMI TaxID=2126980 RepID=A0A2R8FDK1_9VIRU|nr:Transmembrane domain-containing protein [Brazilian cedratvirus IHUMI]